MSHFDASLLDRPVPDQTQALLRKQGYRKYELRLDDERNQEPLVDAGAYGITGQSYYSHTNAATVEPISEVSQTVLIRKTIAQRLALINDALKASEAVSALLGSPVELFIEEGLRSRQTQTMLYSDVFPRLIRTQFPGLSQQEVLKRRDNMIAQPSKTQSSPSPHATGAAIDISLRYKQNSKLFVPNSDIFMGHHDADLGNTARPDFYEQRDTPDDKERLARRNRRLFYWIMRGTIFGTESGFSVNPSEWWHWSYGDQMWATLTEAPFAFYGNADDTKNGS